MLLGFFSSLGAACLVASPRTSAKRVTTAIALAVALALEYEH